MSRLHAVNTRHGAKSVAGLACGLAVLLGLAACKPRETATSTATSTSTSAPAGNPVDPATSAPQPTTPAPPAAIGETPQLAVDTLDGRRFDLAAQRGQWVVVNYWATWCGPCLEEMPELSALDAMREHVHVIGLAYEDTSSEELRAFLGKHPVAYPIARIEPGTAPPSFGEAEALPKTWLIGPDGKLLKVFIGPVTAQGLEEAIAAAGPKPGSA